MTTAILTGNHLLRRIRDSLLNIIGKEIGKFLDMSTGSHAHKHIFYDSGHPKVQQIDFV